MDNPCGCPQSAKVGTSHRLNYISNSVGTGLALSDKGSLVKGAVVFLEQKND